MSGSNQKWAFVAMVSACTIWGLSPLYYKALADVPPLELLSHRTIWSLFFIGSFAVFTNRIPKIREALSERKTLGVLAFSAVMISVNWFLFIFSVQVDRAVESSLGYYIFPLVMVGLGALVYKERFTRPQAIAVTLALLAVVVLTAGLGVAPWISLALAVTFAFYGLAKKMITTGPISSVTVEVILLAPLALIWLWGIHSGAWVDPSGRAGGFFGLDWSHSLLLMFSGILTGGPLILFSQAAQQLRLSTVGLIQYLNPTLQLGCATLAFGEPLTKWHVIALAIIWCALAIYSTATIRAERRKNA